MNEEIIICSHPVLKNYIHSYWTICADDGLSYLLPPDPYFNLVLSYKKGTTVCSADAGVTLKSSFLSGMRTRPFTLNPDSSVDYLAVAFYPWGLRPFLSFSCRECTDVFLDYKYLSYLADAVASASELIEDNHYKITAFENILLKILYKAREIPEKALIASVNMINGSDSIITVQNIADETGISVRRMNRLYEKFLGISPKMYIRIQRFNRFLDIINAGIDKGSIDFADLSYLCGYYDQSHMINECRMFSGLSPAKLIA